MRLRLVIWLLFAVSWLSTHAHIETISFADATAKQICVNQWDSDGDGEISFEEAAAVTSFGSVFCRLLLQGPSSLDELQYFTSVEELQERAFTDCYHLRSIVLPASIKIIHDNAFYSCVELENIQIPTSTQRLGRGCFYRCTSLEEIRVPPSVRDSIPMECFAYCSELKKAEIEANVRIIGKASFIECSRLQSVTLPYTTTLICDHAFSGCGELRQVFCRAKTPPSVGSDVFDPKVMSHAVLFVPEGSIDAYKKAPVWSDFKFIAETFD